MIFVILFTLAAAYMSVGFTLALPLLYTKLPTSLLRYVPTYPAFVGSLGALLLALTLILLGLIK